MSQKGGIGGHDVDSRWVDPVSVENQVNIPELTEVWKVNHMLRSRYFVMYKKCQDVRCCKPYRSPILSRLPSGFLPAPRVFKHNQDGNLELADPEEVDATVKFASLSNILAQPIQQDLPFDTFNRKVDTDSLLCPFCKLSLCSEAEVRRHRVAMHRSMRVSGREEFKIEELKEVDEIREIIDQNGGEYLCVMEDDEDLEWKKLSPSHPLIKKFKVERMRLLQNVNDGPLEIKEDELDEFMSSVFEEMP